MDLYRKMLVALPDICLIASGGVSSLQDIEELEGAGCPVGDIRKSDL